MSRDVRRIHGSSNFTLRCNTMQSSNEDITTPTPSPTPRPRPPVARSGRLAPLHAEPMTVTEAVERLNRWDASVRARVFAALFDDTTNDTTLEVRQ